MRAGGEDGDAARVDCNYKLKCVCVRETVRVDISMAYIIEKQHGIAKASADKTGNRNERMRMGKGSRE